MGFGRIFRRSARAARSDAVVRMVPSEWPVGTSHMAHTIYISRPPAEACATATARSVDPGAELHKNLATPSTVAARPPALAAAKEGVP